MTHRISRTAMRLGLLPAGIAVALVPAFASAQDAAPAEAADATTLDRIEVTGSRIRGTDMETQQPIITIDRAELQKQGFTSVADVLQNLTSSGSPAIARAEVLASGENVGGYYVDLRNLGAGRTLVLINGKRLGATTGGLQDLSQIPMSAINRIEVLKDGASAIYGSDAIAGVVNVITRKRFEGAEANVYLGQYSEGDGFKESYDFTVGATGDRGGVTVSVEYTDEEPVWAKDRWYSKSGNAGPDYPGSGWSPVSQNGSFFGPCGTAGANTWCTLSDGADPSLLTSYRPHVASDNANSNEQMMAQTGIERRSVFVNANYDITDNIIFNADMLYNHRSTLQQVAGYPYQSQAFGTPLSGDSAFNPMPGTDVEFRRRLWEAPRTTNSELETYRFAGGFSGFFDLAGKAWDWDVGASMNRNNLSKYGHGDASLLAAEQALGPSFINGQGVAQCGTAANPVPLGTNIGAGECTPWNPLLPNGVAGQGSLSDPNVQKFLFPYYTDSGLTRSTSYTANLAGSLFELPAGEVGVAVGVEHRIESGRFVPDAFNQAGASTGLPATTTEGQYSLDEVYAELSIPLLRDVAFAKELTLSVASRYSDYSNFGDTTNSKFGFTWRPMDDLLVRGTWAEGFRAPTIDNLYGGVGGSFEYYTDPCGAAGGSQGNAACTAAGVSPTYVQLGQGGAPCTSYPCQTPNQFLTGSNPNLTPETATTTTLGLVYSPRFVSGLDFTLDWYKVEIENVISDDSVDDILSDCYALGIDARCAGIQRDPATGSITFMRYGLTNKGKVETEGYDFGVKYRLPETAYGNFTVDLQNSYVSMYQITADNAPGSVPVNYTGRSSNFRLRSNLTLNWNLGAFGANWTTRYYSGMSEKCVVNRPCTDPLYSSPDTNEPGSLYPLRRVGGNAFHDVQVNWQAPWNATIALGANNVTDHRGPIMFSAPSSQYPYYGGFDIGRTVYMKYQQRF